MTQIASCRVSISTVPAKRRSCCSPVVQALFVPASPRWAALPPGSCIACVPAVAMDSTPLVLNTAEEAVAIRRLLPPRQSRVLLVTSAFHMRRAQRLFERQGMQVLPFPVDFKARGRWAGPLWRDTTQWLPSARALDDSSRAMRELLGRLLYEAL